MYFRVKLCLKSSTQEITWGKFVGWRLDCVSLPPPPPVPFPAAKGIETQHVRQTVIYTYMCLNARGRAAMDGLLSVIDRSEKGAVSWSL